MIFEQVIKFIVAKKTQRYSRISILQKLFKIAVECRLSGSVLKRLLHTHDIEKRFW